MTRHFYILIILTFQTTLSFACLNTYQFKVFPVGVSQDKIVTIDVQIRRTSTFEGNRMLNLGLENVKPANEMWILYSYISTYDKKQKLISLIRLDTTYSVGKTYADTLDKTYQRGLKKIATAFSEIVYFKPEYISFCDFQQKCNIIKIQSDTISNKDYVVFEGKKYQTEIVQDTSYYGFDRSPYHPVAIAELYINSVRIYKTKSITFLVAHLATGHELSPADEENLITKEHKPNLKFTDIKKSTYEEPLLHHGYGFDIFIIK